MSILINNLNGVDAPGYSSTALAAGAPNIRSGTYTLAMRCRFNSNSTSNDRISMGLVDSASIAGAYIGRFAGGSASWNGIRYDGLFGAQEADAAGYNTTTQWQHYALTYDGTNIRAYRDGALIATTASATTTCPDTANVNTLIAWCGQSVLADVAYFNRVLNAEEITRLARDRGAGQLISGGNCFGFYPEFFDSFATDYSGRGNHTSLVAGTGTNPAADNEGVPVGWLRTRSRLYVPLGTVVAITADGLTQTTGTASVTSSASVAATGLTQVTGAAALGVAAGIVATGLTQTTGTAAVSSTGSTVAAGLTQVSGEAAVTAAASIVAAGLTQTTGTAAVSTSASGALDASGLTQATGLATLQASLPVVAPGLTQVTGAASVSRVDPVPPPIDVPTRPPRPMRRPRIIWTDPLPPVSQYVNVLGTKLKVLLRAPSGVVGNDLLVTSWVDEVTGTVIPRTLGAPTFVKDGSNFSGKSVVRTTAGANRLNQTFALPLLQGGSQTQGEAFGVFRAASLNAATSRMFGLFDTAFGAPLLALQAGVNSLQLNYALGAVQLTASFTDVVGVHFVSGRLDVGAGLAVLNLDGVDVASAAIGAFAPANDSYRIILVGTGGVAFDGFGGLYGLVQSPMSTAERAEILRIARQEFGF
ncbi:MAG TPA: LamG-like jellyroll fold domain-containing protein [Anaerolineae bacterium]|nr:LamG-like jellyroll fold domain-containing protein [Anaerolineae bacterium]